MSIFAWGMSTRDLVEADRHEHVVDLAVRGVDAELLELERARVDGDLPAKLPSFVARGARLVWVVDGGVEHGEVGGLADGLRRGGADRWSL